MRRMSKKTAARLAECREFRQALVAEVGCCEVCGCGPWWALHCHEIARGAHRQKALDKRYAILIVCLTCHDELHDRAKWPEARQLAVLKRSRPADFDLAAYNALIGWGEYRITARDVEESKSFN